MTDVQRGGLGDQHLRQQADLQVCDKAEVGWRACGGA